MTVRPLYLSFCLLLLAVGMTLSSCVGCYSFRSGSTGLAQTVAVDFFRNKASQVNPSLSQIFTEKLKDKFQRETQLRLVARDADITFSGHISSYTISPVAVTGDNQASQSRLTITVHVKHVNIKEPKKNFEQSFSNFTDFDASQNLVTVETAIVDDVTTKLVQGIFNKSVSDW